MKIGNIELLGKVILGPMAGITTLAYREFMKPFGVALSYSEMISDCGIAYGNGRTFDYLKTSKIDRPIGLQLFGFDIKNSEKAIKIIEKEADFDILDLNFGCPVPKVTRTGSGSDWLRRPQEMAAYAKAIVSISSKPVTAKIRLGWSEHTINVFEVCALLQEAGISAITVHCRTKEQGYSGKADYSAIKGLKDTLRIPLIVSGDIFTLDDAIKAVNETGADAVMVARGGVGNPFLVTQIDHYFKTGERLPSPSGLQQVEYAERFAKMLIDLKGEEIAIRELRGILPKFFFGHPGYKKLRVFVSSKMTTMNDLEAALRGYREEAKRI